jgi:hypothetical protein
MIGDIEARLDELEDIITTVCSIFQVGEQFKYAGTQLKRIDKWVSKVNDRRMAQGGRPIKVGDKVDKMRGYSFPGIVVSIFQTAAGCVRVVVEADVQKGDPFFGMLHIYSLDQLRLR